MEDKIFSFVWLKNSGEVHCWGGVILRSFSIASFSLDGRRWITKLCMFVKHKQEGSLSVINLYSSSHLLHEGGVGKFISGFAIGG